MTENKFSSSDPNSFSNPDEAVVKCIHLSLNVDFNKKILAGFVELEVKKVEDNATELLLDTEDLKINSVIDLRSGNNLEFTFSDPDKIFGTKLAIKLPDNEESNIRILYETSSKASALQWLAAEQTAGGKLPYMFSQCQPIHCRSMLPCQDSPAVKAKYTAVITAPSELRVLMSAIRDGEPIKNSDGTSQHKFHQDVPMPSYLIAIAVGNLESRELGPRSCVWSEPEYVDSAAYEFAETETMLKKAEEVCGPYVWGIYDILLMPPSFPYGGMENPCLTFVTPTLLAGDRSLAGVVAHEISHSWTGNLVTNRNFEHFWLNEGFTMFVERKIIQRMQGEKIHQFSAINGLNDLREAIKVMGADSPLTKLVVNLEGVHPDDAFSSCPYEKGFTFLFYLETQVGGPDVFEPFLKKYLDHYKYQSIDTNDFKKFFLEYFDKNEKSQKVDWDKWLYTPGMPPIIPDYDKSLVLPCTELTNKWIKWDGSNPNPFTEDDLKCFDALQIQEFLAQLLLANSFTLSKVILMQEIYQLNKYKNSEIRFRWLRLCIKARWYDVVPLALEFATKYGRMKFVRPIFRDLGKWEETRDEAIRVFRAHQHQMMNVTAAMVAKDLEISLDV
ncbi:leukotriene A-4 hydrolase [Lycorma delicatula]|uniref:leukotriene A-4 hydrolase n=1 Tax=Lycorma delicatula TaxID=130591 RepID=UPI003F50F9A5